MNFNTLCRCSILLLLSGCSFVDLHNDLQKQGQLVTITGQISATPPTSEPLAVVLVKGPNQNLEIVHHQTLKQPGEYTFITDPGTYRIFAFEDSNRDGKYTVPERVQRTKAITATEPGSLHGVDIIIPPRPDNDLLVEIGQIKQSGTIVRHKTLVQIGTIISLDDPNFAMANAGKGLWQPYQSLQEIRFGLFFIGEYDPEKKIVLFIHGVSGTPQQFKTIIANLDHDHFQPLVAFYPSGFPLPLISQFISSLVDELYATHNIQAMTVVAHSMGGLVAKGFINIQNNHKRPLVDSFISISTPWGGHATAKSGLKYAPVVIPVWRDIVPGSDFLKTLDRHLQDTPHYLLFGFKGTGKIAGENGDGVVSIASQLKPVVQQEARLVRGFNEDHVSILKNGELVALINKILAENL